MPIDTRLPFGARVLDALATKARGYQPRAFTFPTRAFYLVDAGDGDDDAKTPRAAPRRRSCRGLGDNAATNVAPACADRFVVVHGDDDAEE